MTLLLKKQKTLEQTIKQDFRIVKLFKLLKNGVYSLNTTELIDELTLLHQTRAFREFKTDEFLQNSQKNIISWQLEMATKRSRVVAIRMDCFRVKRKLEQRIKNTRKYLLATYANQLKTEISTAITGRKDFIDNLLEDFIVLEFNLDSVVSIADMLLGDLAESKWNCRGIIDALSITHNRE